MKKLFTAFAVISAFIGIYVAMSGEKMNSNISSVQIVDMEVMTTCESAGWWDNNGNCVHNDKGTDFCKKDTWYEITDCIMD